MWHISSERNIGPYFFEIEAGAAVTINGVQYRTMLENLLRPAMENYPQVWFQQDGATAHTARQTMALLRDLFNTHALFQETAILIGHRVHHRIEALQIFSLRIF